MAKQEDRNPAVVMHDELAAFAARRFKFEDEAEMERAHAEMVERLQRSITLADLERLRFVQRQAGIRDEDQIPTQRQVVHLDPDAKVTKYGALLAPDGAELWPAETMRWRSPRDRHEWVTGWDPGWLARLINNRELDRALATLERLVALTCAPQDPVRARLTKAQAEKAERVAKLRELWKQPKWRKAKRVALADELDITDGVLRAYLREIAADGRVVNG